MIETVYKDENTVIIDAKHLPLLYGIKDEEEKRYFVLRQKESGYYYGYFREVITLNRLFTRTEIFDAFDIVLPK